MKNTIHRKRISIYSCFIFTVLSGYLFLMPSCQKSSDDGNTENKVLLSYKSATAYSKDMIQLILGNMVDSLPELAPIINNTESGVDMYTITYKSSFQGRDLIASGLVCLPQTGGTYPLISFQNGTNTLKSNCPSLNPAYYLFAMLECMAGNGYIVVFPDYLGFGSSAQYLHPYYDRESSDRIVTDMILATHELLNQPSIKVKSNNSHFLMGYSQGGWATMSLLKFIESNYPGEIPLKAVSCGAGAYDMMEMAQYLLSVQTFPGPLYMPYFIYSQIQAGGITDPLTKFFKEPYAGRIPELFNGSYSNDQVNSQLNDTIARLLTDDMMTHLLDGASYQEIRSVMSKNSVPAWNVSVKLNLYHGTADMNVPPAQSQKMYDDFLAAGVNSTNISMIQLPETTHETSLLPWGIKTILWFNSIKQAK